MMIGFHRANEAIVGNIQSVVHRFEMACHFVSELAWSEPLLGCLTRHFKPVFVRSGLEPDIPSACALKPGHAVGRNRFVGMADMRPAVGIVDCSRDIERFGHRTHARNSAQRSEQGTDLHGQQLWIVIIGRNLALQLA